MNRIVSWVALFAVAIGILAGTWAAVMMENLRLLTYLLLALALFLFWIWRKMNVIIDERLVLIYEKTAVRTLEISILILFLFSVFILGIGHWEDAPALLDQGFAMIQNILLIILVFIIFGFYYSRKFGVFDE
ncbi:hypothetical protein RJ53_02480 [Methanocalculus chunghsingensis]|uniref:DUF2178 domain-containing protein n=1 Tax=Methanocalculus chunghsingensis TaxID=156457 RepID=A0A8J8B468_9EURY|nr:DUF2178 domain-containing protein [Methanocalculus chunghsingensis]MBR1368426.1 hypothetical protein [Methanocalculus chunghsingensis]